MDKELEIYELRIKRLLSKIGHYEPKVEDYNQEQMRKFYLDKSFYKKKFDILQNEVFNKKIDIGD